MVKHHEHIQSANFPLFLTLLLVVIGVSCTIFILNTRFASTRNPHPTATFGVLFLLNTPTPTATPTPSPLPTPSPTVTPTPTPRPLTFSEMNALYGPCVYLPTLFWHHVQSMDKAEQLGHAGLTVDTALFRSQMQFLKDRGYIPVRPEQLIAFFDQGTPMPAKGVLLTFDDGYDDFAQDAAPILREFGFTATAFIPTGLLNNPGYMSWDTLSALDSQGIYLANHTWSHQNVNASKSTDEREIGTADTQLSQHGYNKAKVFAYPYGFPSTFGEQVLSEKGYTIAFTTYPGSTQCKKQRLTLPRTRIGNTSLSAYGL